ncbi:MAG: ASKHA domain-containing protein [Methanomassiliicoccales archaeon]
MSVSVRFYPKGITVEVEPGSTLLEAAFLAGVEINSACGGKGTCGRCRTIVSGKFGSKQTDQIMPGDWDMGYRLACMTKVLGDTIAYIPEESQLNEMQILETYFGSRIDEISPLSSAMYVELQPPTLNNSVGDRERLECALKIEAGKLYLPLNALKELPGTLRRTGWRITPVLDRSGTNPSVIDVNEWDTTSRNYGIALDIGTTTVVLSLIDLSTGNVITQASAYNKQIMCGEDILARIAFAEDGGLERLHRLVIDTINNLLAQVSNQSDKCKGTNRRVCREEITAMSVAGNTTMIHLFLGIHPKTIRYDPYISVTNIPPSIKARELGIDIHHEAPIYCVPGRASYVGGDIVADVISSGMRDLDGTSLLIDVGTNGEIVLGGKDWMASCSCSAGPAFEGGEVACGMRAMPGAIERISIDDSFTVGYSTIADQKPTGICGSGLIDLIACLFRTGIVDKKGKIQDAKTNRVRKTDNGREFVIAWADETGQPKLKIPPSMNGMMAKAPPKKDIVVTDDDLANIIRTKAAVYAACEVLLKSVDMGFGELDRVYVAGGFGNYIDVNNAITIGLLPDIPKDKFSFIGNASLGGARLALMSQKKRDEALEVHRSMTYLELTTNASFFDRFTSASFLPHTDLSQFPSLTQRLS